MEGGKMLGSIRGLRTCIVEFFSSSEIITISVENPALSALASIHLSSISPGEQRLVLLMRALVGHPPHVLLDEALSGMDDGMISGCRAAKEERRGN